MARITICNACERGDHKHHYRVVQAVSPGMLGGAVCTCRGECADGRYESKDLRLIAKMFARAAVEGEVDRG
jgi:hypothetical protein